MNVDVDIAENNDPNQTQPKAEFIINKNNHRHRVLTHICAHASLCEDARTQVFVFWKVNVREKMTQTKEPTQHSIQTSKLDVWK
jgi:hypothetical protein